MNDSSQLGNVFTAVRRGWILKNPSTWKNRQLAVNALAGLLAAAAAITRGLGHDLPVSNEDLVGVAGLVWALISLFNGWATAATTGKVGLPAPSRVAADSDPGPFNPG